jgi:hypothetical protein
MAKRGRRPRIGLKVWRNDERIKGPVEAILRRRDKDDPETVTEAGHQLIALVSSELGDHEVTDQRRVRLFRLAATAKASQIIRILESWRFRLPDRQVRYLQTLKSIEEIRWA